MAVIRNPYKKRVGCQRSDSPFLTLTLTQHKFSKGFFSVKKIVKKNNVILHFFTLSVYIPD